ncbi:hypothetical protein COCNU_07G005610 [Cocos nucifera]|uniref:Uncharacterized protein n=1 Tax=Cocos nucifera TaxID=13894 RepID=A0A8K0IFE2_COCNU|nr:hypothetical protein COCNU_07G005610 [Cocos nucifera]
MVIAAQTPDILGERQSGQDVRTQNVVACQAVANIVKSSLGPVGLDKVVDAVQAVKTTNARGEVKYPIKGINILKAHGKSAKDSYLLNGYALNTGRAAQGMPTRVAPARIACLDFNLQKTKMQMGVQVLVTDPRELEKIRQR